MPSKAKRSKAAAAKHAREKDPLDELLSSFDNIEIDVVESWTTLEVCENFLTPLGLSVFQHIFVEQKVTGHVLLKLQKKDFLELGVTLVGDLVLLDSALHFLRRRARKANREKIIWRGHWPAGGGLAYYESFQQCLVYTCFGPCLSTVEYRFTSEGVYSRSNPPECNLCCAPMFSDHQDYRFLTAIDGYNHPTCCCFCNRQGMKLTFGAKDSKETAELKPRICCTKKGPASESIVDIAHPSLDEEVMKDIKEKWQNHRLVSN